MFKDFFLDRVSVSRGVMRVRHGGSGPAVLLLHGHPRTHATWAKVAELLAAHFTVVCPDLPGFGESFIPLDTAKHEGSSKRKKANDCLELMKQLGHERFAVVGHDRGALVAFRLAMDHPAQVTHLAALDGVPVLEALERATDKFARLYWHWFFFANPDKPERAITADPQAWYGGSPAQMGDAAFADYQRAISDPAVVHGMLEDYRAGLGPDREHDLEDRLANRKVRCPTLCLWSKHDDMEELYGDPVAVWRPWIAAALEGHAITSGHHMAEEAPHELAAALTRFLSKFSYAAA